MLGKLKKNKQTLVKSDDSLTLYTDPNLTLKQFRVGTDDMVELNMHYKGHSSKLLYYRQDIEKMARNILHIEDGRPGLNLEKTDARLVSLAIDMLINLSSGELDSGTVGRLKAVKQWFEAEST